VIPEHKARRWRTLALAREAIELGARPVIASAFTGIPKAEIQRLFCAPPANGRSSGRIPWSAHWYLTEGVWVELQAAYFHACFRTLRDLGHPPPEALIAGYKHYRRQFAHDLRLSFDRAFELVAHVDGLWTTQPPRLAIVTCHRCRATHLAARDDDTVGTGVCPFCRLTRPGNGRLLLALAPLAAAAQGTDPAAA
jgi:hypothetical protein